MQVLGDLQGHPRVHDLAGNLSLIDLCFLLDNAVAVITNDSGPLHIAVAFGTPCVALFGPETPAHYGPMGEQHRVLYKALPCSPCLTPFDGKQFPCPFSVRCLREIRVDEFVEAATEVIAKRLTVPVAS
jgi:ADP-heptose:LPS heptosyltransferase